MYDIIKVHDALRVNVIFKIFCLKKTHTNIIFKNDCLVCQTVRTILIYKSQIFFGTLLNLFFNDFQKKEILMYKNEKKNKT